MTIAIKAILPDVQHEADHRQIPIDNVGIRDFHYPILVLDQAQEKQHVAASFTMSVNLPHHFKGTHMSRFVEVLAAHSDEVTLRTMPKLLRELRQRLSAESATIEASFRYFLQRIAPVTKSKAWMDYKCRFMGESSDAGDTFALRVEVPVTSLCPCSKAISDYGAHNQRGSVEMEVRSLRDRNGDASLIWIEELVDLAERSASSPVYPLLKRPDERYVTMQAYDKRFSSRT